MYNVLFVCTGNICRSPTAEGIFRKIVKDSGLEGKIGIDSAGTDNWHEGEKPDGRSTAEAARHGVDLTPLRARNVRAEDFQNFDLIVAMDESHMARLQRIRPDYPDFKRAELRLLLDFLKDVKDKNVPDPYYGGPDGFEHVFFLIENAVKILLKYVMQQQASSRES